MVATLYFGWHYMVDDIAGLGIGVIAVLCARRGHRPPAARGPGAWRPVIPNALTLARIAMIPLIAWLLIEGGGESMIAAALFAVASLSDAYDGFLARRWKVESVFGALADPFADKLLILASLGALAAVGRVPWWIFAVIAAREVWVTMLRAQARRQGVVIAAGPLGKVKMGVQVCTLLALMAFDISGAVAPAAAVRDGRDHHRLGRRDRARGPAATRSPIAAPAT